MLQIVTVTIGNTYIDRVPEDNLIVSWDSSKYPSAQKYRPDMKYGKHEPRTDASGGLNISQGCQTTICAGMQPKNKEW